MTRRSGMVLAVCAAVSLSAAVGDDGGATTARARNRAAVEAAYAANLKTHADNPEMRVRPGLLADRKTGRIVIQAEATGLKERDTAEFLLIGEGSGHDYEALAVAFAKPGDVHEALCFLGMSPGRPANPSLLQFWPKGERVTIEFASTASATSLPIRAEQLMFDTRTGKALPETGFVFTGSLKVPSLEDPSVQVYAADARDPMSIASTYNEPASVLDVPRTAPQGAVYQTQVINPAHFFAAGEFLRVTLSPEHRDGRKRVVDLVLKAEPNAAKATQAVANLVFELIEGDHTLITNGVLPDILKTFTEVVAAGRDPFVTVRFSDRLTLGAIHELCIVLAAIDTETGIRIEAPPPGLLYYKAFLPDESFRAREKRPAQPWELRLKAGESGVTGILTAIEQIWRDGETWPELKCRDFETPTPLDFRKTLAANGPGLPVILVYAASGITHGQLMAFIGPVLPTHGTVHVFLD